jgi:hypothetical protein
MENSLTNRWILVLGIGALVLALSLIVIRVPVRTIIIFFSIGIPLTLLWMYVDEKSTRQKKEYEFFSNLQKQACICSVCKHDNAGVCIDVKCPCCIMMKGDAVVGHSINPLQ